MSLRIKAVVDKFVKELTEALQADIQDRIMKEREMQSYVQEREREVAEREADLSCREVKMSPTRAKKLTNVLEDSQMAKACHKPSAFQAADPPQAAKSSKDTSASHAEGTSKFPCSPSPKHIKSQTAGPSHQPEDVPSASKNDQGLVISLENMEQLSCPVQALIRHIQQLQQIAQQENNDNKTSRSERRIAEFRELAPPMFEGSIDPIESLEWLEEMEKVFDGMECTDQEKIRFAAYQLQGEAYEWWEAVKRQKKADRLLTWDFFRQEFLDIYFPKSFRVEKENEFIQLTQGNMTVAQYDAKFIQLSCLAPNLVATDAIQAKRFEKGLRPKIRARVVPMQLNSYRKVVNVAKIVEQEFKNIKQERERQNKKRSRSSGPQIDQGSSSKVRRQEPLKKDDGAQQKDQLCYGRYRDFYFGARQQKSAVKRPG